MNAQRNRTLYGRWIWANGWSEAVALGTTIVVGRALGPLVDRQGEAAAALLTLLLAVLLGTFLEGVVVGWAQERVLRARLPALALHSWTRATAVGAGVAWLLGMLPSTIMALVSEPSGDPPAVMPPNWVMYLIAAALGLVAGPMLGFTQWLVLRRHVRHAGRWLLANAVAWFAGMPVIFVGMDLVPWDGPGIVAAAVAWMLCGTAGLVVGTIHGYMIFFGILRED